MRRMFAELACVLALTACANTPTAQAATSNDATRAPSVRADMTSSGQGVYDDLQVLGDFSVAGAVDLGQTGSGAFSIGAGYVEVAGAPLGTHKGVMLFPQAAPAASTQGPILYFDSTTRKLTLRMAVSDGGGIVALQ